MIGVSIFDADETELVIRTSPFGYRDTLVRLTAAIEAHGATVFAVVDHATNAARVGLELPSTAVVIFGNPAVGTHVMLAMPNLALDLPSRVLVRCTVDGTVEIVYRDPGAWARRYGLDSEVAWRLAGLVNLVDGVLIP